MVLLLIPLCSEFMTQMRLLWGSSYFSCLGSRAQSERLRGRAPTKPEPQSAILVELDSEVLKCARFNL